MMAMVQEQETVKAKIAVLKRDIGSHTGEIAALEARRVAAMAEGAAAEEEHAESVPRVQHSISLYATISGIRWDYSKEERVAGVVNSGGGSVAAFDIDPKTTNRFDITQQLWDMIDAP